MLSFGSNGILLFILRLLELSYYSFPVVCIGELYLPDKVRGSLGTSFQLLSLTSSSILKSLSFILYLTCLYSAEAFTMPSSYASSRTIPSAALSERGSSSIPRGLIPTKHRGPIFSTSDMSVHTLTLSDTDSGDEKSPNQIQSQIKVDENISYPTGWKLVSITIALCCAVFVVTLVCSMSPAEYLKLLLTCLGPNDYCYCNSTDNR